MGFRYGGSTTNSKNKGGGFRYSGDKSKITYVPLTLTDGKQFGEISYGAYMAIENNTLDSYKPKDDKEKSVLDEYKKYVKEQQEKQAPKTPEITDEEQNVFAKYGFNPTTFNKNDFESWAKEHNFEYRMAGNDLTGVEYKWLPKRKSDLMFWKTLTTDEEEADKEVLERYLEKKAVQANAKKYPTLTSVATVATAPIRGIAGVVATGKNAVELALGKDITTNDTAHSIVEDANLIRETVTNEHASKWFDGASGKLGNYGALTYNGLMSIGDTVMTSLTTRGIGSGLGLTGKGLATFTSNITSGLLASNSASSTIIKKKNEGMSDGKAVANGIATGLAEFITEKISLDMIFKSPTSMLKKGVIGFFAEGSEEMASDIISKTADYFISGNDSDIKKNISKYMQNGMSKKDATYQATWDSIYETLSAGLVGGLSGVAVSSAYHGFGKSEIKKLGADYRVVAEDVIQSGLESPKNTTAYKHANKLAKKGINNISDYELGLQHTYNVEQIDFENKQAEKATKKSRNNQDVIETAPTTVSVGDVFQDTKYGGTIEVVGRDDTHTVVTINTGTTTERKIFENSQADHLATSEQYEKIRSSVVTIDDQVSPVENATVAENETVDVPVNTETSSDTMAIAENATTTPATETTPTDSETKTISLRRVGDSYELYGNDALALAEELDMETTRKVVNGVKTDVLTIPENLAMGIAEAMADDGYSFAFSDKPSVSATSTTEAENEVVTDETKTMEETTSSEEESVTEDKISVVSDAISDTLTPQAKEDLQNGEIKNDYSRIAQTLIDVYEGQGSLEGFETFFVDGGKKVIEAIEGKTDTTTTEVKSNAEETHDNATETHDNATETNVDKSDGATTEDKRVKTDELDKSSKTEKLANDLDNEVEDTKALKNERESDTIESTKESNPVEREENGNESIRESVLHGNGKRRGNESTRKQTERFLSFRRKNQGKDGAERQRLARELIEQGQVEEVIDGNHKYKLVNKDAYNDDMLSMVKEAKRHGVELMFCVGEMTTEVELDDGTKVTKNIRGLKISPTQILVRYDANRTPQQIFKHEYVHAKYKTPAMQKIKNFILGSLSEEKKQDILSQERYAGYAEVYRNNKEKVWEEFVCDVMAGMNDYTSDYIDTVNDYWYGNETVDNYKASEYTESIDAGGNETSDGRYDVDDSYTENEYRRFGWVRANDILSSGEYSNFTAKFADAVENKFYFPKSKDGEFIIAVSDINEPVFRGTENVLVFAEGKIDNLVINSIIRIYEYDEAILEKVRGYIYGLEHRGIHVESRKAFTRYYGSDFADGYYRRNSKNSGHNNVNGVGNGNSAKTQTTQEEGVKYDLDNTDSKGKTLSEAQQEYFKDSKVRDENGNLLVVYHGTRNKDFTVFNRNHNYYTDNRAMAESYAPSGALYEGYLNITNPYIIDASGAKWSAIPVSDEVKKMLDEAGSSTFKEKGKWCTSVADIVSAISDMVDEGEADYDGVIIRNVDDTGSYYKGSTKNIGNDYITFKSEQFKNTDNTNPTTDPDIRYDLSDEDTEYMKAVENGDTETASKMIEEAAEKAFANSKVRGDDGKLKLVYHGRVSDFNVFDRSFANIEGDFGKGYYFTSNEYDVDANYANEEGPDLKNKISRYAEQLEFDEEYSDLSDEEREEIARQKFITSEPNTITAYLNMENPVYITPDEKGTFLDFNEAYDEEYDEYGEPEGLFVDFIEALKDNASDYAYNDVNFDFLWEHVYDEGGMYASDAVKIIKNNIVDELTDDNGDLAINEVIRLAFEEIGFDGIIDTSVYYKFNKMDGMDSGTTHYIVFDSEQIKSADIATYDDKGNVIPISERFNKDNNDIRYDVDNGKPELKTQKKIESMAQSITHDELIELAKQNTQEFVDKVKENKSLQKRLKNAKRQMLLSPNPVVNVTQAGKVTKDILKEMDSTLKAKDLKDEIISIYNEHAQAIKKAGGVESKVQEANDTMVRRFATLAVDIADNAETFVESEMYSSIKSYVKETRIKVPDDAKSDMHYAEFRKSHMGTFNLTNDGLDIDIAYQELCDMFPGIFDAEISNPADQLLAIADKLDALKPYAYNPHSGYMQDAIDHIVYRFVSEADGIAASPKTKAQKMAEKAKVDKDLALYKERENFERKLDKHKATSERNIQKLQKKLDDFKYVQYWEKRLFKEEKALALKDAKAHTAEVKNRAKEEKARAIKAMRDRQKTAVLKSKIRNIVSDMKKKLDKNEKTGGYPKELVKTVAEVCSALDFHTDRTSKDGSPTKVSLKLDALKMEYDALKNNENYDFASEYREEVSDKIGELYQTVKDKRVVDLNLAELSELKDILSEINHSLSIATKQIGNENAKANAELAWGIIESLEANSDLNDLDKRLFMRENKLGMQSIKATILNPHRINEMIAGYDHDSVWWKLHDAINRGNRKTAKFVMEANKPFDELTDGGGNEIAFYDFRTKKIKTGIKYIDGSEVEIPKSIICEMVMMWNRKDGKTHLETGGATIPDIELYNKGKTTDAIKGGKRTKPITANDIVRLKGLLDSYDMAWIDRAHSLFNKVSKDAINSTSMELVGRELAKTENYISMYVNQDFVGKEVGKDQDNNITLEGHGSLKETKPKAKQPLLFRGLHENVYDNIEFVSKYYGLAIPIRNFNKVYRMTFRDDNGQSSVKEVIGKKFGAAIQNNVVEQYIKELQSPRKREHIAFDKIKGNWLGATFWGNISSALKQTSSYWTGSALLGEDALAKGLKNFAKNAKQTKAEINKYSGTLYKRSQGFSTTELGDRANRKRLAGASNKVTKFVNEKLPILKKVPQGLRPGNWLQAMDVNTSAALWEACKVEVSKTMKASDEGYMQAVTDLWERVIEETQSNYDVIHRPESLKRTDVVSQTLTMFTTDAQQKFGLLFSAYNDFATKSELCKKGGSAADELAKDVAKKRLYKASRSIAYSALWMGFVSVLGNMLLRKFKSYIDDEEKDVTAGSVAKQYMLFVGEDLFNTIMPVGSSLILQAADTFNNGYDFASVPTFDVIEDFIVSLSKIYKAATDDGDVLGALADSTYAISNITGVPVKNISDIVKSIKGYAGDIKELDFAHDIEDYTSGNKSFYSYGDLASSICSGDTEKETKVLDYYSENGKEFNKGSLTEEIKPAYVQMYVDSPEKAAGIKRKLISDYEYDSKAIGEWAIEVYLDNILTDPEYAEEIKESFQSHSAWKNATFKKVAESYYKSVYKEGKEKDIEDLRNALISDAKISSVTLSAWEREADKQIREKEKDKYR